MQRTFNQYNLSSILTEKYSHVTYLASPANEPDHQVILTVFASSLLRVPHEQENFLQKARHIKELQHPHLMPVLEIGIAEEQPFVIREYLPNGSLRGRIKQIFPGRMELEDALIIVSQAGKALAYMHEQKIVHGNIKPENILFDANGQVLLTDVQLIARTDAIIRDQTSDEYAFCYLAPEQFAGTCDARSDQYALGCLAYELITGRVPFIAQSLASMMGQPSWSLPAPLTESVANLPRALEVAVLKTLAKDPNERFFDFLLFLEVIQSILSPAPPFPLLLRSSFRKKRNISHPVKSTKAETSNSPSAAMLETRPQLDMFSSEQDLDTQLAQEEANEKLFSKLFEEEEINPLPLGVPADSLHGQDTLGADDKDQLQASIIDLSRTREAGRLDRKRVLAVMMVLSILVALFAYEFWPFEVAKPGIIPHTVQNMTNGANTPISKNGTDIPTGQASAQATPDSGVQVTTLPTVQSSLPLQTPIVQAAPPPAQESIANTKMLVYFYGWTDNSPAGASIAYPKLHSSAGGVGTYSNPITFGTSASEISPGTIIYVQYLKKYFIMEDGCSSCDSDWKNNHRYEIVLWIGGDANSSSKAIQDCENSLTQSSSVPVVVQPSSNLAVDTTPLFTDSGGCIKL